MLVQLSIEAASKCHLIEILDGDDTEEYIVGRKDKGDITIYVKCEFTVEGNLKGVSCSCRKLQSIGTPAHTTSLYWAIGENASYQTVVFWKGGQWGPGMLFHH